MMARAYDTRPNLEGYDALTVRGIAKFLAVAGILIGAQLLADHYGVANWLHAAIQLGWVGLGLKVMWIGIKAWKSGDYPPGGPEGPRYAETAIRFVSPRAAAIGEMFAGALLIADALFKLTHIFVEF